MDRVQLVETIVVFGRTLELATLGDRTLIIGEGLDHWGVLRDLHGFGHHHLFCGVEHSRGVLRANRQGKIVLCRRGCLTSIDWVEKVLDLCVASFHLVVAAKGWLHCEIRVCCMGSLLNWGVDTWNVVI